MSTAPHNKRYYRDCYGNRAVLDDTGCVNETFSTPWDARREMRAYSGNTWTEVGGYGYQ